MNRTFKLDAIAALATIAVTSVLANNSGLPQHSNTRRENGPAKTSVIVHDAMRQDVSPPLWSLRASTETNDVADCQGTACGNSPGASIGDSDSPQEQREEPIPPPTPPPTLSPAGIAVEQTSQGRRPAVPLMESFDGLGAGFEGPQGSANFRSPSDDSLAIGPDHVVQIVNARIAIYSKKGKKYDKSGTVLYGAMPTKTMWAGFGGVCDARNNGDAVVRYDQLAGRWLFVMPIFSRIGPDDFRARGGLNAAEAAPPGQLAKNA